MTRETAPSGERDWPKKPRALGILSEHSTVRELEMDIIEAIIPVKRDDSWGSSKGGTYIKVVEEAKHLRTERDIAVGALRMIAGEAELPPSIIGHRDIARDAIKSLKRVGRTWNWSEDVVR